MNSKTENTLYEILKRCMKYAETVCMGRIAFEPLEWFVSTGRSSGTFDLTLAQLDKRQITTIAKRLVKCGGGNYDESLNSVKEYIGKINPDAV